MPAFFDEVHRDQAISSRVIPALEAIAATGNRPSLRRFERDDPPPYVSSTKSEDFTYHTPPSLEKMDAILERPIDDREMDYISHSYNEIAHPKHLYYEEAKIEERRLMDRCPGPRSEMFKGVNGERRKGVIIRHNIKRRWEKLGIWNPEWGFAGRRVHPNDDYNKWAWKWQPDGAVRRFGGKCELIARSLHLRKGLRRGQHVPITPQSCPTRDTSDTQAEAFLTSRPWFIFQIEVAEEKIRRYRLDEDEKHYPCLAQNQVIKWWKDRGDWKAGAGPSWKWRHESPSPEPEDITTVHMKDNPMDVAVEMEFTPSEIDEFETIALPRSEQPESYWVTKDSILEPEIPGQMIDFEARNKKRLEESLEKLKKARSEGYVNENDPAIKTFEERSFPGEQRGFLFGPPRLEKTSASEEPQVIGSERRRDASSLHPQRQPRAGEDKTQNQPRRSARIAGMKRAAEPTPSQTSSNKRAKRSAEPPNDVASSTIAPATQSNSRETCRGEKRPIPARAPSKGKGKGETKPLQGRGRGRPRNGNRLKTRSVVGEETAGTPDPAGSGYGMSTGTDEPSVRRGRGRPRKNE